MGWNDEDKKCQTCGQVTEKAKGWNKQNVKKLFSLKMSATDVLILIMIVGLLMMAYFYNAETSQCRSWIGKMNEGDLTRCVSTCSNQCLMLKSNTESVSIAKTAR